MCPAWGEAQGVIFAAGVKKLAMQLEKLRKYIDDYCNWLRTERNHPRLYWWETQEHFRTHWNTDTSDLAQMYLAAIDNTVTRRPWQEERWYPKDILAQLINMEPISGKLMFDDLFDETKESVHRMDRCIFFCDTLLAEYRKRNPLTKENDHFHSDYRMISLYLALRYPESYVPYRLDWMKTLLIRLGARDLPEHHDCERFFKVNRTLYSFLEKDGRALPLLQAKLYPKKHFTGKTLLPALDLSLFIVEGR
jgi:hypothetical protein